MVHKVLVTLAVTLVSSVFFCFAQEENSSPDRASTPGLQDEAQREFEETDAKLRGAYDALLTQLNVDQRRALDQVQTHWLAYRDMAAKTAADLSSPSEEHTGLLEILEMHRLTEQRLEALERIIEARRTAD